PPVRNYAELHRAGEPPYAGLSLRPAAALERYHRAAGPGSPLGRERTPRAYGGANAGAGRDHAALGGHLKPVGRAHRAVVWHPPLPRGPVSGRSEERRAG